MKKMQNYKVFLGGTCAQTTWRDDLIKLLKLDYFNPVVDEWKPEDQQKEIEEKNNLCNVHFYCITSAMKGVFSIAEAVDSVHNPNKETIFQVMPDGFDKDQLKSLGATIDLINSRGGIAYFDDDISRGAIILNKLFSK
jgi:hypothetical protein